MRANGLGRVLGQSFPEQRGGSSVLDLGSGPSISSIIAVNRFLLTSCQGAILLVEQQDLPGKAPSGK